jgi:hypothetical protein
MSTPNLERLIFTPDLIVKTNVNFEERLRTIRDKTLAEQILTFADVYNNTIAGRPISMANNRLVHLSNLLVENDYSHFAEAINKTKKEMTNSTANKICGGESGFFNLEHILKYKTPKGLSKEDGDIWKSYQSELILNRLNDKQREILVGQGIEYFSNGTADFKTLSYEGVVIFLDKDSFDVDSGGRLHRLADRAIVKKELKGLPIPDTINIHHQMSDNKPEIVLVDRLIHRFADHLAFPRYSPLDIEKVSNFISSNQGKIF